MAIVTTPYYEPENGLPNQRKIYVDIPLVKPDIVRMDAGTPRTGWTLAMRKVFTPHDAKTRKQLALRAAFLFAYTQGYQGQYHLLCFKNRDRWANLHAPAQTNEGSTDPSAIQISAQTATPIGGGMVLCFTPSSATNLWGIVILRDVAEIVTPDQYTAIKFFHTKTANQISYVDSPLKPGTYHYRAAAFETNGQLGSFSPDVFATVL